MTITAALQKEEELARVALLYQGMLCAAAGPQQVPHQKASLHLKPIKSNVMLLASQNQELNKSLFFLNFPRYDIQ